jgi:hypothetical protein
MAKIDVCDCCGAASKVGKFVMDKDGVHKPPIGRRQNGLQATRPVDLCESCSVALGNEWKRLSLSEKRPHDRGDHAG